MATAAALATGVVTLRRFPDDGAAAAAGERAAPPVRPRRPTMDTMIDQPPPGARPAGGITVVDDPASVTVLVNKGRRLPPGWEPPDLVPPDVPFIFDGPSPKRLLRAEAAAALEQLFAAADRAGIPLAAVSGFRAEHTQSRLFSTYAARDGEEQASRYSARPGHSEHQTGLAMDVTGIDGACAAEPCFAGTPEALWLDAHAADHGFVIRYPEGAEALTGHMYEPWHLRYVGPAVAAEAVRRNLTLDELLA